MSISTSCPSEMIRQSVAYERTLAERFLGYSSELLRVTKQGVFKHELSSAYKDCAEITDRNTANRLQPAPHRDEVEGPSVYWHARAKRWACKVGYWLLPSSKTHLSPGRRVRSYQYFSKDQSELGRRQSEDAAKEIQRKWVYHLKNWPLLREWLQSILPQYDWSKSVWTHGHPFVEKLFTQYQADHEQDQRGLEQLRRETDELILQADQQLLEGILLRNPDIIRKLVQPFGPAAGSAMSIEVKPSPSIGEVRDKFVAAYRAKVGLKSGHGLKANSFNNYKYFLEASFRALPALKPPVDVTQPMRVFTLQVLQQFVNFWFNEDNRLSARTAKNYCITFYRMLEWAEEQEEFNFQLPKGSAKLFAFGNVDPINIAKYHPAKLIAIRKHSSERQYLYQLLGLAGMYQGDIAHLRFGEVARGVLRYWDEREVVVGEIVRLVNGEIMPLTYEEIKAYDGRSDIYAYRVRDRTEHKVDERNKSLIWLFPETGRLLAKFLAPKNNPYGCCLLGEGGTPLVTATVQSGRIDALGPEFTGIVNAVKDEIKREAKAAGKDDAEANAEAAKFRFSFKQFRKVGVTAVAKIATQDSDTVVRLYRSQPPVGDAKFYLWDDYETKLTPVLKRWAESLRADRVLVDDPSED